jgi:hypothetical protein
MGSSKMDGIAVEDIGKCAYGIFKQGSTYANKHVGISGGKLSIDEYAAGMSKALGRKVVYNRVTADQYRSFGFPGAVELGNMFQFYDEQVNDVGSVRDIALSKKLNPAAPGLRPVGGCEREQDSVGVNRERSQRIRSRHARRGARAPRPPTPFVE